MNLITRNLSWDEVDCHDGTWYPYKFVRDGRLFRLAQLFEEIRGICGSHPIKINSGYRSEKYNYMIGGVLNSQHIEGRALDLHHSVLSNDEFHSIIDKHAKELGIGGLGHYRSFVHVDIRLGSDIVKWTGK